MDNGNSLENAENIETYLQDCKSKSTHYLTDDILFKIVTICLMSISRLKIKESSEVQGVVAVALAILSQLLQFTITRLEKSFTLGMTISSTTEISARKSSSFSKFKDVQESQISLGRENDRKGDVKRGDSTLNEDNNISYLNETNDQLSAVKKKIKSNNGIVNEGLKNTREKSRSLLSKLRRRKREDSSDSDISDADQPILVSSSDEMHSDMSEEEASGEEDDALSEENGAPSDDEELLSLRNEAQTDGREETTNDRREKCDSDLLATEERRINSLADERTNMGASNSVANSTSVDTNGTLEGSSGSSNDTFICAALSGKRNFKSSEILNMLLDKEILASIKVCCDWLRSNSDITRICAKSSRILLRRVTILLNLIGVDGETFVRKDEDSTILTSAERLRECVEKLPLPEDIDLKGLNLLEDAHKPLDWYMLCKHKMSKREETLLRVLKLIEFGHYLATAVEHSGIHYDRGQRLFIVSDLSPSNASKATGLNENSVELEHPRGRLMSRMGKLWLKAEVRALENQLCFPLMSLYLVPDYEALAKYTPVLKSLVHTKKFIVVIPTVGKLKSTRIIRN